ncbi:hypothetical protein KEM56_005810, partial [Ascosphaera pollenicola]
VISELEEPEPEFDAQPELEAQPEDTAVSDREDRPSHDEWGYSKRDKDKKKKKKGIEIEVKSKTESRSSRKPEPEPEPDSKRKKAKDSIWSLPSDPKKDKKKRRGELDEDSNPLTSPAPDPPDVWDDDYQDHKKKSAISDAWANYANKDKKKGKNA